jgi:hypothetical protein
MVNINTSYEILTYFVSGEIEYDYRVQKQFSTWGLLLKQGGWASRMMRVVRCQTKFGSDGHVSHWESQTQIVDSVREVWACELRSRDKSHKWWHLNAVVASRIKMVLVGQREEPRDDFPNLGIELGGRNNSWKC